MRKLFLFIFLSVCLNAFCINSFNFSNQIVNFSVFLFNLENDVEDALKREGIVYKRGEKFGDNGSIGEIDFQVNSAIIEVTESKKGKLSQIKKLISNKTMNPNGKRVILYAPNYNNTASKDIENAGAEVIKNMDALIKSIK